MNEPTIALTITSLIVFAVFAGLFVWGLVSGQFQDIEEAKYRMLELDPGNKGKGEDEDA